MTVIAENLDALDSLHLDKGSHSSFEAGHSAMEVVSWLAGQGFTDAPECASIVLREFTISLNDSWSDEQRQELKPFLPRMVGTGNDGQDEARSFLALDWLIRTYTPAWLDLAGLTVEARALRDLRRICDLVAAQEAGPVAREARDQAAAAWDAARAADDAAGAAARAAARAAAWDAARAAARAADDAAGAAARAAARDAAWDAARAADDAAGAAAWDALKPTVEALQASALDLLDRMIDPSAGA